jgi:CdiI immunity protein
MRAYASDFPYLNDLVGGYFHQDWKSDGDTSDKVLAFYCRMERPRVRSGAVADIDRLLRVAETEQHLICALHQFGCALRVESPRDWLVHIRQFVQSSLEKPSGRGQ